MITVVVGLPGVGKTYQQKLWTKNQGVLCEFAGPGYKLFDTDQYRSDDYEQDLYTLRNALRRDLSPNKLIIGVLGFRLLRKGIELGDFFPETVVMLLTKTDDVRKERFKLREGRLPNPGFDKSLFTIWKDYLDRLKFVEENRKPKITEIYV